jgi:hypothetical protein
MRSDMEWRCAFRLRLDLPTDEVHMYPTLVYSILILHMNATSVALVRVIGLVSLGLLSNVHFAGKSSFFWQWHSPVALSGATGRWVLFKEYAWASIVCLSYVQGWAEDSVTFLHVSRSTRLNSLYSISPDRPRLVHKRLATRMQKHPLAEHRAMRSSPAPKHDAHAVVSEGTIA